MIITHHARERLIERYNIDPDYLETHLKYGQYLIYKEKQQLWTYFNDTLILLKHCDGKIVTALPIKCSPILQARITKILLSELTLEQYLIKYENKRGKEKKEYFNRDVEHVYQMLKDTINNVLSPSKSD